jgi:hypothetical protein
MSSCRAAWDGEGAGTVSAHLPPACRSNQTNGNILSPELAKPR